ncbi:MAG: NAD(P)/FAD-dependent oxidoreductase [Pseudomonadota bacterium]
MQHFDVIIVGAGLSGIGAAYHLQQHCPGKSYAILESRAAIGGTWDLFRYPGIRSDSDMHTLGYNFKPWRAAKAIADGPSIRSYVREVATENGIEEHIQFGQKLTSAAWNSDDASWVLTTEQQDATQGSFSCNFLLMCAGYYSYDKPYTPDFPNQDAFKGAIIHPQLWPEDLDYAGKKVVVIGSGATAMTLVPAMAETAGSVTMLQRSPTYVVSRPDEDRIANTLRKVLPEQWAYNLTRWKNTALQGYTYNRTRTAPEKVKAHLLKMVREELGPDFDVEKHFTPTYNPWDQRLCLVPNSDLFKAIRNGKANVVTEQIDEFTETGIALKSGEHLDADIIITATGLNMVVLGGAEFSVDGQAVNFPETFTYKGMMYSDVPNMVQTFGYINASWTLRADLTAEWVCRVLNAMNDASMRQATPRIPTADSNMPALPWVDDFSAGYMQRVMHLFPRQSDRWPWQNTQNYAIDRKMLRNDPVTGDALVLDNPVPAAARAA